MAQSARVRAVAFAAVLLGAATQARSAPVTESWVTRNDLNQEASGLAVDSRGFIYATGDRYLTIQYDLLGNELWARRPFATGSATALAVDADGNVIITGDRGTVKYSIAGDELWRKTYPDPGAPIDAANAVDTDSSGNIYVGGVYAGDFVLIKYRPDGSRAWYRLYDGAGSSRDEVKALTVDPAGNVYVTGSSDGLSGTLEKADFVTIKYDGNGVRLWEPVARYDGPGNGNDVPIGIGVDGFGNVYVAGQSLGAGTDRDFATVKYAPNGAELWVARRASGSSETPSALAVTSGGEAIVTGSIGEGASSDFWTVKYDAAGIEQWVSRYDSPGSERDFARDVVVDPGGNVYVTGASMLVSGSGTDFLTVKYNPDGGQVWEARYDCFGWDTAGAIALDPAGNVYVAGAAACFDTGDDFATIKYVQGNSTTLEVQLDGPGGGTVASLPPGIDCGSDCIAEFVLGTAVELTATAGDGAYFVGWDGDCSGTETCGLTMDARKTATARFDTVPKAFIDDATVTELNGDISEAVFEVGLTKPISVTAEVAFATADGTAIGGPDYWPASGVLEFPPGSTRERLTVAIPTPLPALGDKIFFMDLASPVNLDIADARARATISALSPQTRVPAAYGFALEEYVCPAPPVFCFTNFEVFTGVDPEIYTEPVNPNGYTNRVGLAEFDVRGIDPGLDAANLNLAFKRFESGGFGVSYLPVAGNGTIDADDYWACRNTAQRIPVQYLSSDEQRRIDVREALQWATANDADYLTFCFHEGTSQRLFEITMPTLFHAPSDDVDEDGVVNTADNCLRTPNGDQANFDGDPAGDACDPDDDNDGLTDAFEFANLLDPYDTDMDDDGLTDFEEACYDGDCDSYDPGVSDTDATLRDTDGGAKGDYLEVRSGTDALDGLDDLVVCQSPERITDSGYSERDLDIDATGTNVVYQGCDNGVGSSCFGNRLIYHQALGETGWATPTVISGDSGWHFDPAISDDGNRVVFVGPSVSASGSGSLYVTDYVNGDWTAPQPLTGGEPGGGFAIKPVISGDGLRVFYHACDADPVNQCATGDYEIYQLTYEPVAMQWLGPTRVTDNGRADYAPVTNAGGDRLAYVGCVGGTGYNCIGGDFKLFYARESRNGWDEAAPIADFIPYQSSWDDVRPALSADGERILFVAHDGVNTTSAFWDVYRMDFAAGAWQPAANFGGNSNPSISADGLKLAFDPWVYLENRDGTWLGPIPVAPPGSRDLIVSADGNAIAYRLPSFEGNDDEFFVTRCVAAAIDSDGDGVYDDGDWSGSTSDAFCGLAGAEAGYCDDNCAVTTNPGQTETDADGIGDACDNCTAVPNPWQRDTDADGYGNYCDADLDNNGFVNFADLAEFRAAFGTGDADADLDGNGFVNFADLARFRLLFGKPPGPSAVAP